MFTISEIELFKKYLSSPLYAFGGAASPSIVSKDEKELYWKIFSELELACKVALKNSGYSEQFYVKAKNYSKERGVRGHRPKDLWCAIRNKNSETFNEMPQIYIIASDRGIEAGFAVSIPESDYSNMNVKMRNREIIPRINKKLPIEGPELEKLDELFANNKNLHVNLKTRLVLGDIGFNEFPKPSDLFKSLKNEVISYGGGSLCKIYTEQDIIEDEIDTIEVMEETLDTFGDLLKLCLPSEPDKVLLKDSITISENLIEHFNPENIEDSREFKLRSIAQRQGQKKFRSQLLETYEKKCVITNCNIDKVLQAAHIKPYRGKKTNHLQNGILLRSDIHDLFDLFLISINPLNMKVVISDSLLGTYLDKYSNKTINLPHKIENHPSKESLNWHFNEFEKTNEKT